MALSKSQTAVLDAMSRSQRLEIRIDILLFYMNFHLDQLNISMWNDDTRAYTQHKQELIEIRHQLMELEGLSHKEC